MADPADELSAVGVAGALSTNYACDARTFLPLLATVLESAMPAETTVWRRAAFFSKQKTVSKVAIESGDYQYVIEDAGNGRLVSTRTHTVRGIQLKHEHLAVQVWLTALSTEIAASAKTNEQAYFALKNMLDYT